MNIFDLACQTPWAMTQEALQGLLTIAARENLPIEAVEAQLGRPLDNTHNVTYRNGVATIPVEGPIFRRADMFTRVSGATDISTLAQDLKASLDNPSIASILFAIDSPGGEVNGVAEFADMIYAARGRKPIVAYVSDTGASAAYWIASACDEIVAAQTAAIGSIGVVAAVPDPSHRTARTIEFVSSQSPDKRPDPTTDRGKAQVQAHVDGLADIFVDTVARNRGVTRTRVLSDFGKGGLLLGQQAVRAGLVDRVGSYEALLDDLASGRAPRARAGASAASGAVAAANPSGPGAHVPGKAYSYEILDSVLASVNNHQRMTPERRREILSQTAGGQAILAREDHQNA